jgi:type IV pilus assembly protein PilB
LTGHMVLSTLHTNDAPSTVNRLLNMGVEPFLVTASTNLILAQRLARKVCPECKAPVELTKQIVQALIDMGCKPEDAKGAKLYKGEGCRTCSNTGYKGRIALYEVMPFNEPLKELVLQGSSTAELKAEAIRLGMKSLRQSGLSKILEGVTAIEEVARVTAAD